MNNHISFQAPPLSKVNKWIIVFYVGSFLLGSIMQMTGQISLVSILGLSVGMVKKGIIIQFLTYPFAETSMLAAIFNSLILWFIGAELELKWGAKFYATFLSFTAFVCGIIYFIVSFALGNEFVPLYGITGMTYALLVAYGIIYSERQLSFMMIFPMKAKYFCLLLAAIQLYLGIFSSARYTALAHLCAMIIGVVFLRYKSMRIQSKKKDGVKRKNHGLYIVKEQQDKHDPKNPKFWQ